MSKSSNIQKVNPKSSSDVEALEGRPGFCANDQTLTEGSLDATGALAVPSKTAGSGLHVKQSVIYWPILLVFALFMGNLLLWVSLDHTPATWDGAGHALRGYICADILRSNAFFLNKFANLLKVDSFYTPFAYWVHGLMLYVLGDNTWVDSFLRFFWYGLAGFSLYSLAKSLLADRAIATAAVAIFYLYPITYGMSHTIILLDIPLTAMIFFSLWCMSEWNKRPTWLATVTLGLLLAFTFLTKQTAAIWLSAPVLMVLGFLLKQKRWGDFGKLTAGLSVGGAFILCWVLTNLAQFQQFVSSNQEARPDRDFWQNLLANTNQYSVESTYGVTALGIGSFLVALFYFRQHKKIWIVAACAFGGLLFHTILVWLPQFRYIMPALAYSSIVTGAAAVSLWRTQSRLWRVALITLCMCAAWVFVDFNYTPYPLPSMTSLERLTGITKLCKQFSLDNCTAAPFKPMPAAYGGAYDWIFETIRQQDHGKGSCVLMLPNYAELNPSGFMYYARAFRTGLRPVTFGTWSFSGFVFQCPPEVLREIRWVVITKDSSLKKEPFAPGSEERFNELVNSLENPDNYVLQAHRKMPIGGGELLLYRSRHVEADR